MLQFYVRCLNLWNGGTLQESSTVTATDVSLAVTAATELLNASITILPSPEPNGQCNYGCERALSQNHLICYMYRIVERLPCGISYTSDYGLVGKPCKFVAV
jgi:hypothetical protein